MSLSVCLLTREPAPRIAALLEPLRGVADEVVLAADDRIDEATLAGYAALADRLFTVEFRLYERHLAWLHRQCSCDWILRLDGDEVLSAALVRKLPGLLARRDVEQYMIRRAWLWPDAATALDELPWSTDHLNRLVRNGATLRFSGRQHAHAEPIGPMAYVREPVYHLELLLADEQARRAKAIRYEVARPHMRAPGAGGRRFNDAFYLPELRSAPRMRTVPPEDRETLARALAADRAFASEAIDGAVHVPLEELDATWPGRAVPSDGCRASLRPLEDDIAFAPGESRAVFFEAINAGSEHWPGGMQDEPLIRLSYHWLRRDGSVHTAEGIRTPFPSPVPPGTTAVVPLQVAAPAEAGDYELEVDVLHEHVRWFGDTCRVDVSVVAPERNGALGLRPTAAPRLRLARRPPLEIPRVIHRIWIGDDPLPSEFAAMGETFAAHHPGWELRIWGDGDLAALGVGTAERARARSASELSNVVRYEILHRFGGVYVDTDVECLRDLEPLLRGVRACAALERPGRLGTAVLASVPGHRVFARAAVEARQTLGLGAHSADANGPYFLTLLVEQEADFTVFGAEVFYPYSWDEPERARGPFPDAYAVHRWTRSWWGGE